MPLLAWPPLSADVAAALDRLERAPSFTGLDRDYQLVATEANKRMWPAFGAMLPGMALFALTYGGSQALGWLKLPEFVANFGWILIVPTTALITNALLGAQAVTDQQRIGEALRKWRAHANQAARHHDAA